MIEVKLTMHLRKKVLFDMMAICWSKESEVKLFACRIRMAEKANEWPPRYLNFVRMSCRFG